MERRVFERGEKHPSMRPFGRCVYDWVEAVAFALIFVVLVFTFLFRVAGVQGRSMEPTLYEMDYVVLTNLFYTPAYGDVVVIAPTASLDVPVIKRVIATEGQTVDIDFENGTVVVDGVALDEPYTAEATKTAYDITFPQTVPEGCIFVMGDNRNHSVDSRDSSIGMVDRRYVLGRAFWRVFPLSGVGAIR